MMNKAAVAGAIVLYNPEENVRRNILSISGQVDKLYVVDNSQNKNEVLVSRIKELGNIEYIFLDENVGIGKALNVAAHKAIDDKFDFLITLDQDSYPPENMVDKLLEVSHKIPNVGVVSPVHANKFNTQKTDETNWTEKFDVMSSGNLLNLKVFDKVGGFNEDFFIDFVDIEYYLKLHLQNYKIIQVNNCILLHEEGNIIKRKLLFKDVYPYNHNPLRFYYKTRNRLYLKQKYKHLFPEYFKRKETKVYRRTVIKMLLYEKNKFSKIRFIIKGYLDFKKGIFGNYKQN